MAVGRLEAALVNVCNIPELSKFREPRLKQLDCRRISVQAVASIVNERYCYLDLGRDPWIKAAVADVSDFETTLATILQKTDSIVWCQIADVKVHSK